MNKEALILGCQQNDRAAQTALFDVYYPVVYGIISRYIHDDDTRKEVLQETFISLFSNISRLKEIKSFDGWTRKITIHHCINKLRENKIHFAGWQDEKTLPVEEEAEDNISEITMEDVYAAVEELPNGYRVIFNLFAVDQLSHAEIAKRLGISVSTSKTQFLKAKKALRAIIIQKQSNARSTR